MKILLAGHGPLQYKAYEKENIEYIDLSKGIETDEIMDIYQEIDPSQCGILREQIIKMKPDLIVGVGKSSGYKWDATIIARVFGQFTSWHNQWDNAYGKTIINVDGKDVELYAFDTMEEIESYLEL